MTVALEPTPHAGTSWPPPQPLTVNSLPFTVRASFHETCPVHSRTKRASAAVNEIRSQTLVAVVQDELERQILRGELAPGARLSEQAIATALSVSRGPVREACRALADVGLVTLVPNRGAFVKQL